MKIICSKANLLNGVQIVSKAVPNKTTMSILECILIDASRGSITLTANDMELGIETKVKGIIEEKGIVALDAKLFSDIDIDEDILSSISENISSHNDKNEISDLINKDTKLYLYENIYYEVEEETGDTIITREETENE